jgi:mediator of RNA polymerase II transcription subunit 17
MSGAHPLSTVALRPWPAPAKEALSKEDLYAQVGQLTAERKQYLRDITEKSLLEDIAAGRDGIVDSVEGAKQADKEEVLSQAEMLDRLGKARFDVFNKLE